MTDGLPDPLVQHSNSKSAAIPPPDHSLFAAQSESHTPFVTPRLGKWVLIGQSEPLQALIHPFSDKVDELLEFGNLLNALDHVANADLILVYQSWLDEFPQSEVNLLLENSVFSRMIVFQGPLCASAQRTRGDWPFAMCVDSERFADRLRKEVETLIGIRAPLPWTAGYDEIFAFDTAACHHHGISPPLDGVTDSEYS